MSIHCTYMYMYVYVCIIIICLPSVLPPSFCLPSIPPSFPSSLPPFSAGQTPLSLALGCDSTEVMNQLVRIVQDSTSRKTALHHSIKKVDRPMTGFMVWRCVYMCACVCVCVCGVHVCMCGCVCLWVCGCGCVVKSFRVSQRQCHMQALPHSLVVFCSWEFSPFTLLIHVCLEHIEPAKRAREHVTTY